MAKNIIIYQNISDGDKSLLGFKILNQKAANQFMKAVSLLENSSEKFDFNELSLDYSTENFEIYKITGSEIKVLTKLFSIDEEDDPIGVFPDAINDAYELNLLSDEDEDEEDDYDEYE